MLSDSSHIETFWNKAKTEQAKLWKKRQLGPISESFSKAGTDMFFVILQFLSTLHFTFLITHYNIVYYVLLLTFCATKLYNSTSYKKRKTYSVNSRGF